MLAGGRHGFYYPECKELFYFAGLRQVGADRRNRVQRLCSSAHMSEPHRVLFTLRC